MYGSDHMVKVPTFPNVSTAGQALVGELWSLHLTVPLEDTGGSARPKMGGRGADPQWWGK